MSAVVCIITALACLAIVTDGMWRLQVLDARASPFDAVVVLAICLGAFLQLVMIWPMNQPPAPGVSLVMVGLAANIIRSVRRRAASR